MRPLRAAVVVDASRMLPGAVMARMLLELGARLIKIEHPTGGDPLRAAPPLVNGIGAGFHEFYAGAESLCLDLRQPRDAARLRKLARHADVLVESFRPGSLEAWGLGTDRLFAANPSLVLCRLSSFGAQGSQASRVGHDLNFAALTGLLDFLGRDRLPAVQLADVGTGVLACCSVLAALLGRGLGRRGVVVDQPLLGGALPLLAWPLADAAAGGGGLTEPASLLTGGCAAYRLYRCADGRELALGALEPKFWLGFVEMLGLEGLEGVGLDTGKEGCEAMRRVEARLAEHPRDHWLRLGRERGLPLTAVNTLAEAAREPALCDSGLLVERRSGPFLPSVGRRPDEAAPRLGEHGERISREFGLDLP